MLGISVTAVKRLDVVLVNPPSRTKVYQRLSEFAAVEPPVWALLIAQYLKNCGYSVTVLDAEAQLATPEATAQVINAMDPRLAVFCIYGHQPSASTQCMPGAIATLKALRGLRDGNDLPVMALGTHPSALPNATVEDGFDFVAVGEGPLTIEAYLNDAIPNNKIPGLVGKTIYGGMNFNAKAPLIEDLAAVLPRQAWERVNMGLYRPHNWHAWSGALMGGYASIQTSLGCPFKCSFCCINAPFGGSGIRYWNAPNVARQIAQLVELHGITNIKIPDEMFFLNRKHVEEICTLLIKQGLNEHLNMWAYARVDTVKDDALLALAREAGFKWLGIGVESGSKHVRDGVEKGRFGNEDITRSIARVRSVGIAVGANYIFGLPDDTLESMKETLDLACELNTEWANFYCAMAYPGSPLHKMAREQGWKLPEDPGGPGWIGYSQHAYETMPLPTETLPYTTVLDFRDNAFMHYFGRPSYRSMLKNKFGDLAVSQLDYMLSYGKPKRKHREGASQ